MNASISTQLDLSIQSSAQHWIEQTTTDVMIRGWVQLANIGFVQSNFAEHMFKQNPQVVGCKQLCQFGGSPFL